MMGKMGMMGMDGMGMMGMMGMDGMGMMGMMGMMGKMGMMGMMGMGGMGGMGNCGVEYFYGDAQTGNSCPISDSHVNEADCLAAVEALLPAGQTQGRTQLVAGSWGWVPPGCSVQSHFTHGQDGDWAAHYNRNPDGRNDGGYTPVCSMMRIFDCAGMGMGGMGSMGMMGMDGMGMMGMMGMDGIGMMGMGGMGMGGMGMMGMGGMSMMGGMGMMGIDGMGMMGMDGMGMMGMDGMGMMGMGGMGGMGMMGMMGMDGMGGMGMAMGMGCVSRRDVVYRYGEAQTGNSCPSRDVGEADCLAAVQDSLPEGQVQGRTQLVAGSWGWVPPGCSVQSHFTHGQDGDR